MTHMPSILSSGEIQRVAIARAVLTQPDLLIADEPTGSVDPDMSERLLKLFLEMNRRGTTILIATHDQALLSLIRADIYHLQNGSIEQRVAA
jgi:cell division transport system ATP-binding protein